MSKVAKNLERFRQAIFAHDRENPSHSPAYGIGVSAFDLERLGFEDGEELWSGVKINVMNVTSGNFRVICDGDHDGNKEFIEEENEKLCVEFINA